MCQKVNQKSMPALDQGAFLKMFSYIKKSQTLSKNLSDPKQGLYLDTVLFNTIIANNITEVNINVSKKFIKNGSLLEIRELF